MVASYTQLLARRYQGQLDAEADEFIDYAVDGATRMQTLINDLLAYSRVGTRGQPFAPVDCDAALEQALANLQAGHRGERRRGHARADCRPSGPTSTQLAQLFQNLIGNAIKFRGRRRRRRSTSRRARKDDEWLFSVRDNGIGIDPQYFERIFVIFQRLHARGEYSGHGHRPGDLQEDRRAPRRADLGRVRARRGLHLLLHHSRSKERRR